MKQKQIIDCLKQGCVISYHFGDQKTKEKEKIILMDKEGNTTKLKFKQFYSLTEKKIIEHTHTTTVFNQIYTYCQCQS